MKPPYLNTAQVGDEMRVDPVVVGKLSEPAKYVFIVLLGTHLFLSQDEMFRLNDVSHDCPSLTNSIHTRSSK